MLGPGLNNSQITKLNLTIQNPEFQMWSSLIPNLKECKIPIKPMTDILTILSKKYNQRK